MAAMSLSLNGTELALNKGSYRVRHADIQEKYETEAGSVQRIITREGKPELDVKYYVKDAGYEEIRKLKAEDVLTVSYYDPSTLSMSEFSGFISDLDADLVHSWPDDNLWNVSFTIEAY